MPSHPIEELNRQIAQRESDLQALRQELQDRHDQLAALTQRKEELQSQLQRIEEEIATLGGAAPARLEQPAPVLPAMPQPEGPPRLGDMIVALLQEAARPMTARQICDEAQRRGYQPTSQNPVKSVEARLQDLKHQGVVRRASGQPGYVLAHSANGESRISQEDGRNAAASATLAKPSEEEQESFAAEVGRPVKTGGHGGQPSLREVLTEVLKNSRKPLSGAELAEKVLATGYQSSSNRFSNVVWAQLGKMDNVERTPDKNYRLKKKS